jgi:hypothetical protein
MTPVDGVEGGEIALLPAEQLDGRHAGNPFLEKRVDPRNPEPHGAVRVAHVDPEPLRHERNEREDGKGHDRQAPVHPDENRHDADQREQVAEDRHHTRGEQLVERVDVGGHAGHQPPDRIPVVERDVEHLEPRVDLHPQIEHDALPDHLHRGGLQVFERE